MLTPGAKIMQYRIIEVLGAGGFGITYLAMDEMLNRHFAIKEYFPEQFALRKGISVHARTDKADDFSWGMQRFLEEARSVARFNHPNIVGVSQIVEANNTAYIVLEYQVGRSLKEWLAETDGRTTQEQLDSIVVPLLDALDVIHRNDMLHRDLAPDNIYIRENGTPVILDFGSAREAIATRSKTISAVVKSGYSPAEQYSTRGSGQGPWSDIYALAATLYLCVTGKTPEEATERLIADEFVPTAEGAKGEYRKTFLDAIDWGLRLIPKHRPHSIGEWRIALLQDGPVPAFGEDARAEPVSTVVSAAETEQTGSKITAHRKKQIAAGLAAAVVLLAAGLYLYKDQNRAPAPAITATGGEQPASESAKAEPQPPPPKPQAKKPEFNPDKIAALLDKRDPTRLSAQALADREARLQSIKALPAKELCETALNHQASDWDQNAAFADYVNEAKRRSLATSDCRRLVVAEAAPPPPQAPAEPSVATPPNGGPATVPVTPEPLVASSQIFLSVDRTLAQEYNWTIGFNQSLGGCIASVSFEDQTTMWVGYVGLTNSPFIAFSNPKWASIKVGGFYDLIIDLGNNIKVPATFGGVRGFSGNGVFRADLTRSFLQDFTVAGELGLYLNGSPMTQLSLQHFGGAKTKLNACRDASRRGQR